MTTGDNICQFCVAGRHDHCDGELVTVDAPCLCSCRESVAGGIKTVANKSLWCSGENGRQKPEHKKCTGFHVRNENVKCTCECGHPHLKKENDVAKTLTPQPADTMPDEIKRYIEDPQQFEWWLASRPTKDLTPEPSFTGDTMLLLVFAYLQDRVSQPDRLTRAGVLSSGAVVWFKNITKGRDDGLARLASWVVDLIMSSRVTGQVPYWKAHREVVNFLEVWNARDKEE